MIKYDDTEDASQVLLLRPTLLYYVIGTKRKPRNDIAKERFDQALRPGPAR
jgi:hypothetical protein